MTNSKNNSEPGRLLTPEQNQYAFWIALFSIGLTAISIFFYAVVGSDPRQFGSFNIPVIIFFFVSLFSLFLIRKKRAFLGLWIILVGLWGVAIATTFVQPNLIFIGVEMILGITIARVAFPNPYKTIASFLSILVAIITIGIYLFLQRSGSSVFDFSFSEAMTTLIIASLALITISLLGIQQLRFLKLGGKIGIGFGVLLIMGGIVAGAGLFGLRVVQSSYQTAFDDALGFQQISSGISQEFDQTVTIEKNFLASWSLDGFETAQETHLLEFSESISGSSSIDRSV
ncbi:MAG: hypothetical protein HC806_09550 [Anaerolineae bacterium]|nr:hypothetical protein [Anaerolineae bacterium]